MKQRIDMLDRRSFDSKVEASKKGVPQILDRRGRTRRQQWRLRYRDHEENAGTEAIKTFCLWASSRSSGVKKRICFKALFPSNPMKHIVYYLTTGHDL
jgi:hypothetical protein